MKYCLDLHDFSVFNNRLDLLYQLKEKYPKFKISLFTIPYDIKNKTGDRPKMLAEIKKNLDWMQIIPHGLYHNASEMKAENYYRFRNRVVPKIRDYFNRDGLPYEEGFCAPHWRWSDELVLALNDINWWGAISPARPKMTVPRRFYTYDYAIDEPFWESKKEVVRIHGHIGSTKNDLERCMGNILYKIPHETDWVYVTEFIEDRKK